MIFVGIDASITSSGIVMFDGAGDFLGDKLIRSSVGQKDLPRFDLSISKFMKFIEPSEECAILFEQYAYSSKGQITRTAEFVGQLKRELWKVGGVLLDKIWTCSPGTLKKFATGVGNAPKGAIIKAVYKKWDYDTNSDDLADAYTLGRLLWEAYFLSGEEKKDALLAYERDAIKNLLKQNGYGST